MAIIYEVGPRDGLQSMKPIATERKIELIDRLSDTGLKYIEVASFASPLVIPQMADADRVVNGIKRVSGVTYSALVTSIMYYDMVADLPEIAVVISANERHNMLNLGKPIEETKKDLERLIGAAKMDGRKVRGYIATAWGYHDATRRIRHVIDMAKWYLDNGVYQVSLGDTTGYATPDNIRTRLYGISHWLPIESFAVHFHTRREDMEPKIEAAREMGVGVFDSSIAGLGGCPTDRLLGNIDTRQLTEYFRSLGIETEIETNKLMNAENFLRNIIRNRPIT